MADVHTVHVEAGKVIRMAPSDRSEGVKVGIKAENGHVTQLLLTEDEATELGFGDEVEIHLIVKEA